MLTRSEAADPAVEDLKRRARRRLVGAIVLALAAAVILPLLLESDPKPLGEDVSIQIPPIDNSKFITPLSPAKGTDAKAAPDPVGASTPATPAAAPPVVPAEVKPGVANGTSPESTQAARTDPAPAGPTTTGVDTANPEPQKAGAPAPKAGSGDASPAAAAPAGGFVVQLAAFADAKAAPALASKLKSAGFPAYTEALKTPQGTIRRVRVGPYTTREVADAEMAKLKTAGYRGVVTSK